MKVLFLTIGNRSVASSRARVYSYLPYLRKNGFRIFVIPYTSFWQCRKILLMIESSRIEKILNKVYSAFAILSLYILTPFFDIIYIQKVALSTFTVTVLRALNSHIIFDFDDTIFLHKDIKYLLKNSKCVVVSNKYLREFASRYNRKTYEIVSPVVVKSRYLQRNNDCIILGWIGSQETSKYLYALIPIFKSLKEKFEKLEIEFMGVKKNGKFGSLTNIKTNEWSVEEEERYLKRIDIGIMPLLDNEWTKGKCGYKLLQYMASGIPCVASPVGINKEIIRNGVNGFLADTSKEWFHRLSLLASDAALRRKMGEEGLKLALKLYSYKVNTPKMISVFNEVNGEG